MSYVTALFLGLLLSTNLTSSQAPRISEADRQLALTHLRAGESALATERFEEAEREFKAAIQLNPRLELAHYGLGRVFMATKQYQRAVDAFVSCRNLFQLSAAEDRDGRMAYERRLDDQIQGKRDELGALQSGRIRSSNPASSIDRVREELSQLERLRQRSREPESGPPPFILTALGSAYFRMDEFADAEREWRLALTADPNIGEVHNNLAVVFMLTGRLEEAQREIQLAEKAGFRVSPGLKEDLKRRAAK
jgi:tetratricopeptide (TPR) repeat protein